MSKIPFRMPKKGLQTLKIDLQMVDLGLQMPELGLSVVDLEFVGGHR